MNRTSQNTNGLADLGLDALLDAFHDGLWILNREGTILNVNRAAIKMNGLEGLEVIGKNIRDLHQKGYFGTGELASAQAIEKKRPCTVIQRFRNGTRALVTATPILDEKGKVAVVIANDRDISELNKLAVQLEINEAVTNRFVTENVMPDLFDISGVIAHSEITKEIIKKAIRLSKVDCTVLITGETGVGKGLLAQLMHNCSRKKNRPFVPINCSSIPEPLIESELFGYEYGAFTGSSRAGKKGLVELANRGTLFLDEIGDLSLAGQAKLLQLLENRGFIRLGGSVSKKVDFRLVAATNRNLQDMIDKGVFRRDLFFRLNVVTIHVPPLRGRREDIRPLAQFFLDKTNEKYQLNKRISPEAFELLMWHPYPGNVRELGNLIENAALSTDDDLIDVSAFPSSVIESSSFSNHRSLKEAILRFEGRLIESTTRQYGNQQKAARALNIDQSTLSRKIKRYRASLNRIVHELAEQQDSKTEEWTLPK